MSGATSRAGFNNALFEIFRSVTPRPAPPQPKLVLGGQRSGFRLAGVRLNDARQDSGDIRASSGSGSESGLRTVYCLPSYRVTSVGCIRQLSPAKREFCSRFCANEARRPSLRSLCSFGDSKGRSPLPSPPLAEESPVGSACGLPSSYRERERWCDPILSAQLSARSPNGNARPSGRSED